MKIIFFGTPKFAVPILEMLNAEYDVCLVVTQPDRKGKRNKMMMPPVKEKALELGLEVYQPESIKDSYDVLKSYQADIMITAAYGQFIPTKILNLFKHQVNVHGSLLPKHRGGAPIQRCLMNGDTKTGISIMRMVKKMDSGEVYAMREYEILPSDNNTTLFEKLSIIGRDLLKETLPSIMDNTNLGIPQNEEEATFSYNLRPEEEIIDFRRSAIDLVNQIRGLALEPGAYFKYSDEKFKVYSATVVEDNSNNEPGTIISLNKKMVIKCGKDAISINLIKPASKNLMDIKSFLNGQRIFTENMLIEEV